MTKWWWLSNGRITVAVAVQDGIVVEGPPIVRKFIGQPAKNLGRWLRSQGPLRVERMT